MIRKQIVCAVLALLPALASRSPVFAQSSSLRVYVDTGHRVHVVSPAGKDTIVTPELGQTGIDAIQIADDRQTAGWLVLYKDPDSGSPFAGKLVLWMDGQIIRSFPTDQAFWSWAFEHRADQVAFHVGPRHSETVSHCELHEVLTGQLLESWDGDLEDPSKPAWAKKLEH